MEITKEYFDEKFGYINGKFDEIKVIVLDTSSIIIIKPNKLKEIKTITPYS